jgi:hypothetical protein
MEQRMSATGTRSPFRRRGFVIAAAVVAVIVLAGIIVLVTSLSRGATGPADPSPTPSASPTGDAADESVCGLPGFETENTLTSAPETEWELVGTVAAPTDANGAGPGTTEHGFRSCFAHTAEGALYAAVNFVALGTDSRNSSRMFDLLAAGPARDAVKAASGTPSTPSSTRLQVAGFKVDAYTGSNATVDVAWTITSEGGALVSNPVVLQWEEGDWKVVLTETGAPIAPAPLENLGGYIPWAGV